MKQIYIMDIVTITTGIFSDFDKNCGYINCLKIRNIAVSLVHVCRL